MKIPEIEVRYEDHWNWYRGYYFLIDGEEMRPKKYPVGARLRLVLSDLVIKSELHGDITYYSEQTEMEARIWREEQETEMGRYLVPILDHYISDRVKYVVEPRLEILPGPYSREAQEEIAVVFDELAEKYGLNDNVITENKNWGVLKNGRPIIFDYGA